MIVYTIDFEACSNEHGFWVEVHIETPTEYRQGIALEGIQGLPCTRNIRIATRRHALPWDTVIIDA